MLMLVNRKDPPEHYLQMVQLFPEVARTQNSNHVATVAQFIKKVKRIKNNLKCPF